MTRLSPATVLIMALFAFQPRPSGSTGICTEDSLDIRGDWGLARFAVEIADTPALQARGLMGRDALPVTHGMLFLFDEPRPASFWMKDTRIPLDMIFIDVRGSVMHVHNEAVPYSLDRIKHDGDVAAVLEINGGLAESYGISPESQIRHPRLNQESSLWPCRK